MNRRFVQGVLSAFVVHKKDNFLPFLPRDAFSEPFPQYCSPSCSDKTWRTCASQATLIASSPTAFVPDGVHVHFADKECIAIDHQAENTADFTFAEDRHAFVVYDSIQPREAQSVIMKGIYLNPCSQAGALYSILRILALAKKMERPA